MEESNYGSLSELSDYWEAYCGLSEPVFRLRILTALAHSSFHESLIDDTLVDYVRAYEDRLSIVQSTKLSAVYSQVYLEQLGFMGLGGDFDKFTKAWTVLLLAELDPKPNAYLLALLYANQSYQFTGYIAKSPHKDLSFAAKLIAKYRKQKTFKKLKSCLLFGRVRVALSNLSIDSDT